MDKQLDLAAAYGVLDPCDKRCLNVTERLMGTGGINVLDTQRKGEAYMLHGRSLFLAGKFEDSLAALQKGYICFREMGNFKLRRQINRALLRVLCALGRGREASERLEVALTMCEDKDDCVQLYITAKQALEHTGCDRDAEILDDIWYVFLDTHPEEKKKFEEYEAMGQGLCRQFEGKEERTEEPAVTWEEMWQRFKDPDVWRQILPEVIEDMKKSKLFQFLCMLMCCTMLLSIMLLIGSKMKENR